jgi:PKD repeat protein
MSAELPEIQSLAAFFITGRMKIMLVKDVFLKYPSLIIFLIVLFIHAPSFAGDAVLSWNPPTTNSDGTVLEDLAGYNVYYGTESGNYTDVIDVGDVTSYDLSGLSDGITYYFAVIAYNASGDESAYSNEASKTIQAEDATPPAISGVYTDKVTSSSVTVNWYTDEAADTQVEYGTESSYGETTSFDTSLTTSHSQTIHGLLPSTLYHYRVLSSDASNNLSVSGDYTFTTEGEDDASPPVITNLQATDFSDSSVTITWTTDKPSTSQVEYGLTSSYGSTTEIDSTLVTSHYVTISGLEIHTPYECRAISMDETGNEAMSENFSFTTSNVLPEITSFLASPTSGDAPLQVDFSVSASDSDGYITDYYWDFDGDGNFDEDTLSETFHTYSDPGAYVAIVRAADDGGGSAGDSIVITVTSDGSSLPVISSFTAFPSEGEAPLQVAFSTDISGGDGKTFSYLTVMGSLRP